MASAMVDVMVKRRPFCLCFDHQKKLLTKNRENEREGILDHRNDTGDVGKTNCR